MKLFKSTLVILALSVTCGAFATSWVANGPKRKIETLVIVGNYQSSRLMAELIQNESRQPYILLPAKESESQKIVFFPAKNTGHEIPVERFNHFVRFSNPSRIVIFGDDRFVQEKYVKMLDRAIPIVRIEGADWNRVAEEATKLLNLSNLAGDYRNLREDMIKRQLFRPTPAGAAAQKYQGSAKAEEAAVDAVEVVEVVEVAPAREGAAPVKAVVVEDVVLEPIAAE